MNNGISDIRAIRILIGNTCMKTGKSVFQIFLNIFIWKQTQDIQVVAVFNLLYLSTHMVFFTLFAPIVKKGYRNFLHVFSLVGFASVYLWIMYLGQGAINHLITIPILIGFFNSIYWITYHNVQFDLTTYSNRGHFEGLRQVMRKTSAIVTPAFIGLLITINFLGYGYEIAFGFGASLFLLGAIVGAVAPKPQNITKFDIITAAKKCFCVPDVRRSLTTYSFTSFSFSNSIIEVLIPIVLFTYSAIEFEVGSYVSFFAIASIVASYIMGKYMSYKSYRKGFLILGGLYVLCLLGFIIFPHLYILVLFSAGISAFGSLFAQLQKVVSDNVLHQVKDYTLMRSEYMLIREWFQAIGWILSFVILYFLGSIHNSALMIIFGAMICAVIISSIFLMKTDISIKS